MALAEGQIKIRDLVIGRSTSYKVRSFNPWGETTRVTGDGARPWGDGGWTGTQWRSRTTVHLTIRYLTDTASAWHLLHDALTAALAPTRTGDPVELTWMLGGREALMYVHPHGCTPAPRHMGRADITTTATLTAYDPSIYSATPHSVQIGLPVWTGGSTHPLVHPVVIDATATDGTTTITNAGTVPAALLLRVDGPVANPRITVAAPGGTVTVLHADVTLTTGEWLDIDTEARTVVLNGTTSRLAAAWGGWPLVEPGTSTLRYQSAGGYNATTQLTAQWRDRR